MFNNIKDNNLNLIEPTLVGLSGHEYGYVASLIHANKKFGFNLHIWLATKANDHEVISKLLNINNYTVYVHKYFIRPIRQIQKIFLYYKLLKNQQLFYVCTSGLLDLIICDWLIRIFKFKHLGKIAFFHFHQFNKKSNKIQKLNNITLKSKENFKILTTTSRLSKTFIDAGFKLCAVVPCPSFAPKQPIEQINKNFNKILYAGVARSDKGFSLIVDTIIAMQPNYAYLPFTLQIFKPNSNKYDAKTKESLVKLQQIVNTNDNIKLYKNALTKEKYQELFLGAICLLAYEQSQYADKFSGVTLDAFYAGCPVITVNNTWMGDLTLQFDAGIVLENPTIDSVSKAILQIIDQYNYYHDNAKKAAKYLIVKHDPKHSLQAIYDYL